MLKLLYFTAGHLSLSLGIAGILIPVLPTTPFLLLAAFFYTKSSRRLYSWLLNHRILGLYVRGYIQYRAITRRGKIVSILVLWLVISASALFVLQVWWGRCLLFGIALGVTIFLLRTKTLTKAMIRREGDAGRQALTAEYSPPVAPGAVEGDPGGISIHGGD